MSSTSQSSGVNRIVSSTPTRAGIKVTPQQMVSAQYSLIYRPKVISTIYTIIYVCFVLFDIKIYELK